MIRRQPGDVPPWVIDWLSESRVAPYVRAAGANGALELYRRNCRLSSVAFELIGWFEVAWRNAVDRAITANRADARVHWLFDRQFPLQAGSRAKVANAVRAVRDGGIEHPTSDQVIAELTLGFWRFTTKAYALTIWAPYLARAFPYAPSRPRVTEVDAKFRAITLLRNRIAHHEPIFGDPDHLRQRVADMLLLGRWMNPEAAAWWSANAEIQRILE